MGTRLMGETAPLVSIPEAPAPKAGGAEWYTGADGAKLRAGLFPAEGAARGSVVLSPGRSEPIEKYFEVIGELTRRGFTVLVHDWRGQGLSARWLKDPMPGHAKGWRTFLTDYGRMIAAFETRLPKPWIGVGHSMGGGLTALALAEGETRFVAAVLSAPMLGLNLGKVEPRAASALARFMSLIGRGGEYATPAIDPFAETFDGNILTHDERRYELFKAQLRAKPEMRISAPTFGWVLFALALFERVRRSKWIDNLAIPLTIVLAEHEKLCSNAAAKAVARRAPQGKWVEVEGALHEILMETDPRRAVFWSEFDAVADTVAPRTA
jgi:lysophospholipase